MDSAFLAIQSKGWKETFRMREKCVLTDTSCLILLQKIDRLHILNQLFRKVIVTGKVREEYGDDLPDWIEIRDCQSRELYEIFASMVDEGEATALSLAWEIKDCTVVLDDLKARKTAIELGFKITGTLGLLVKAKKLGFVDSLSNEIDKLLTTDFRISKRLIEYALNEVGE